MKNIIIRNARKSDAEQFVKLKNTVWKSAYAHFMPKEIFDDNDAKVNERIAKFKTRELNKKGSIDLVAIVGDKIVALVGGDALSSYDHYKELGFADLCAIYIDLEYQNCGIGRKLFEKVTRHFRKLGCKKMVIGVFKDNVQARKAYEKWGCVLDTTYEEPFEKMGYTFPEVFYIYDLIKERK